MTETDRKSSRIRERRKNTLFAFRKQCKEDINKLDNFESCKLEEKNDIESHDSIMSSYPNYFLIWYTFIIDYKQKLKIIVSTKIKSILKNIKNNGSFVIVLSIFIFVK